MFTLENDIFETPRTEFNPAVPTLAAWGWNDHGYISTAALAPAPYTSQSLIQAKLGGLIRLIEAVDDSQPPIGNLNGTAANNPAIATLNAVIQNVTTEITGYLSSIYPFPLMQIGTVAIVQVATLTADGLNGVASLNIIEGGNYLAAPSSPNTPAYIKFLDPQWEAEYFKATGQLPTFHGSGLQVSFTTTTVPFSDESGQVLQAVTLTPGQTITITAEGKNYCVGDVLVLTGGQSFVPAKLREAALSLICHDLYQRRLAPEEKNMFALQNKKWRGTADKDGLLTDIGNGNIDLDGTYRRFYSPAACWGQKSVLWGANSL